MNEWIRKWGTYAYGILLSNEKGRYPAICDNMDGLRWHYASNVIKWDKSDRERQVLYDITNMWNLQKPNLLRKKERENRVKSWSPGDGGWGGNKVDGV